MRKFFGLSLLFALLLSFGLLASLPMTAYAIDEVTPTPAPNQDNPGTDNEVDVEELINDAIADLQAGDFDEAIDKMDTVLEIEAENTTALFVRGVAYAQLGEYEDAADDFSTAIELEPWTYEFYIFRGDVYRLMGEETDALLDYDAAIDINPVLSEAFYRRSDLSADMNEDDAADFDDLLGRAIDAMSSGDAEGALSYIDEALDIDVDDTLLAVAYYNRGSVNMQLGESEDAIDDFTNAIEADDNMDNAYLARGILYRLDGDMEAAAQDFYQRIQIKGEDEQSASMEIGDTLEIEMAYRRVYTIEFEGEEGQEITLSARENGDSAVDPLIVLLDPDGNPIAGDDDSGVGINALDSEIADFELPADGTYTLIVSHAEGGYAFGFNGTIEVEIND